jgi:hypothetical protein
VPWFLGPAVSALDTTIALTAQQAGLAAQLRSS